MSRSIQSTLPVLHGYSAPRFWHKLGRVAVAAGRELVEKALWLYFAAQRPDTPRWARATIYGALAYFILPADAIPDLVPAAGFVDDLGVLMAALGTVAIYVDASVKAQAGRVMARWFPA